MDSFWEMVIPAMTISFIFMVVFGFFGFMRYLRYKETIFLAERGLLRPDPPRKSRFKSRRLGIILLVVGVGFGCSLLTVGMLIESPDAAVVGVVLGILPASFGFALLLTDRINRGLEENNTVVEYDDIEDPIPPHK